MVCAGKLEGLLSVSAFSGLLRILNIPYDYATRVCSQHLLKSMVKELCQSQNTDLRVVIIDGVVHTLIPAYRLLISHQDIIKWLDKKFPLCEAILAGNILRITLIRGKDREVLPGDFFGIGWEIISSESGWGSMTASRFAIRRICGNGILGFDKFASVCRDYNSSEPVLETLGRLSQLFADASTPDMFKAAVDWAAKTPVGKNYEPVLNYLSRRLEGDATKSAMSQLTDSHSWYDFVNGVTTLAKKHQLAIRRRYEIEGGLLMNWFASLGRAKPPWRTSVYDSKNVSQTLSVSTASKLSPSIVMD